MAREVTELTASSLSFMAVRTTRFITTLGREQVYFGWIRSTSNLRTARLISTTTTRAPLSIWVREWRKLSTEVTLSKDKLAERLNMLNWVVLLGRDAIGLSSLGDMISLVVLDLWNWSSAAGAQLGGESGRTGVLCLWQHDQRDWERLPRLGRPIRNGTHAWHWVVGKNQEKYQDLAKMCNR